jgi:hypothetical protein
LANGNHKHGFPSFARMIGAVKWLTQFNIAAYFLYCPGKKNNGNYKNYGEYYLRYHITDG